MRLNYREQLIYDMLFCCKVDFDVNLIDYVDEKEDRDFMMYLRTVLLRGKVDIISERLERGTAGKIWKLKLRHLSHVEKGK